jgi:hypothetical protein
MTASGCASRSITASRTQDGGEIAAPRRGLPGRLAPTLEDYPITGVEAVETAVKRWLLGSKKGLLGQNRGISSVRLWDFY